MNNDITGVLYLIESDESFNLLNMHTIEKINILLSHIFMNKPFDDKDSVKDNIKDTIYSDKKSYKLSSNTLKVIDNL